MKDPGTFVYDRYGEVQPLHQDCYDNHCAACTHYSEAMQQLRTCCRESDEFEDHLYCPTYFAYTVVQLIQQKRALTFNSLKYMAEKGEGSFVFILLNKEIERYLFCGEV